MPVDDYVRQTTAPLVSLIHLLTGIASDRLFASKCLVRLTLPSETLGFFVARTAR